MQWFRLYANILDDPKIQGLPPDLFKHWINVLALTCRYDGKIPSPAECAFSLRVPESVAISVLDRLQIAGLIDKCKGGVIGWYIAPHNWHKWQYKSDTSTERVKRFRAVTGNVSETPPETDTEADTEREEKEKLKLLPKETAKRGSRIPEDFLPDASCQALAESLLMDIRESQTAFEKFMDHWRGVPGQRGCKLDWQATFRNWLRSEAKYSKGKFNGKAPKHSSIAESFGRVDAALDELARRKHQEGA